MNIKKKYLKKIIENFLFEMDIQDLGDPSEDLDPVDMAAIKDEKTKKALADNPPEIVTIKERVNFTLSAYDEKIASSFYGGSGFPEELKKQTNSTFPLVKYVVKIPIVDESGNVKESKKYGFLVPWESKKSVSLDSSGKLVVGIKGGKGKIIKVQDYIEKNYKDNQIAIAQWGNAVQLVTKERMKKIK